ncbi:hypothetical protein IEO21_01656 [Rhodonia placenta]|uniref:Uncharacterized protein n=1 Tax=Rhodonia placenta TaxID=104341 RepID=A0A8H7U573_9APHY|nr:hypothetical protein IEO21_01656 [Postia placenta]
MSTSIYTVATVLPINGSGGAVSPSSVGSASATSGHMKTPQVLGAVFGILGGLLLLLNVFAYWRRSRRRNRSKRKYDEWIERRTFQTPASTILAANPQSASTDSLYTAEAYMSESVNSSPYRYGAVARSVSPVLVIGHSPELSAPPVTPQPNPFTITAPVLPEPSLSGAPETSPAMGALRPSSPNEPFPWTTNIVFARPPQRISYASSQSAQVSTYPLNISRAG